jgi:translation elongation factor EF-Tu-like GTPase
MTLRCWTSRRHLSGDVLDSAGLVGKEVEVVRGSARVAVRDDTESQKSLVKLFEALEKITA